MMQESILKETEQAAVVILIPRATTLKQVKPRHSQLRFRRIRIRILVRRKSKRRAMMKKSIRKYRTELRRKSIIK
jgi:hypothetical protein